MKKVLILKSNKDNFEQFYITKMQSENICTAPLYKFKRGIGWIAQVLWLEKLKLPIEQIWYGKWWRIINTVDMVIIFDRNLSWRIVDKIRRKNPHIRVVIWYWNIITVKSPIVRSKEYEIWSFDEGDCVKYGFKHNSQFYFSDIKIENIKFEQDVLFVGKDKGRRKEIKEIEKKLKELGISADIRIVSDKKSRSCEPYDEPIDYMLLIEMIQQSKAILDVVQKGQQGMTARVLESIFLRKKLISTEADLCNKEYYDVENMYIWDKDGRNLIEFINKPYIVNFKNEAMRDNYSFHSWVSRFQ